MGQREFVVDTKQLESLSDALCKYPSEIRQALREAMVDTVDNVLNSSIPTVYTIPPEKLKKAYRVRKRKNLEGESPSVKYEVAGKRLSYIYFDVSPLRPGTVRPFVEIVRGKRYRISSSIGADGKRKSPFVMSTGARDVSKEQHNVFVHRGIFFKRKKEDVSFTTGTGESVVFKAKRQKIGIRRTVSVPQMMGNSKISKLIRMSIAESYQANVFRQLELHTGILQQNIIKG